MKKQNLIIGILIVVIAIILIVIVSIHLNTSKNYLLIDNENVYFGMAASLLIETNGEPVEINKDISDTPQDEYIYTKEAFGKNMEIRYYLYDGQLVEGYFIFDNVSFDSALTITENIISKQKNYYSSKIGYYLSPLETDNTAQFKVSNGVGDGATGVSFDFEYIAGKLTISAICQKQFFVAM